MCVRLSYACARREALRRHTRSAYMPELAVKARFQWKHESRTTDPSCWSDLVTHQWRLLTSARCPRFFAKERNQHKLTHRNQLESFYQK